MKGKDKMTKQKEIDWGLRSIITTWTGEDGTKYLYDFSDAIRVYLHSQDIRFANGESLIEEEK